MTFAGARPLRALGGAIALCAPWLAADARADEPENEGRASIVLVGSAPGMTELGDAVVELLVREHVRPRVVLDSEFDPEELLAEGKGNGSVWAFVVPRDPNQVRLYFRDPGARHFLIRNLALRDGFDAYGCEMVAQVVESSVVALLHATEGLTREQVRAELKVALPHEDPAPPPPALPPPERRAVSGWFALRYGVQWAGSDVGAAQGPGLETGLAWGAFAVRFSAERFFPQSIATPGLEASVQSTALRLSWRGALALSRASALVLGLGAGADVVDARTVRVEDPTLTAAAPTEHLLPVLRPEIALEIPFGRWRLLASAFADVDLAADYYQAVRPAAVSRLATPWPIRPGLALVFGWAPTFGGGR